MVIIAFRAVAGAAGGTQVCLGTPHHQQPIQGALPWLRPDLEWRQCSAHLDGGPYGVTAALIIVPCIQRAVLQDVQNRRAAGAGCAHLALRAALPLLRPARQH